MTAAASPPTELLKLPRLNTKEQLPLCLNTGTQEGPWQMMAALPLKTHLAPQMLNVSREEIIIGRRQKRRKCGDRRGHGEVQGSGARGRKADRVNIVRLKGSSKHSNSLAAGRQPERGHHSLLRAHHSNALHFQPPSVCTTSWSNLSHAHTLMHYEPTCVHYKLHLHTTHLLTHLDTERRKNCCPDCEVQDHRPGSLLEIHLLSQLVSD